MAYGMINIQQQTNTSSITESIDTIKSSLEAEVTRAKAAEAEKLPISGGTMTGAIAMSDNKITNLADPTDDADAVTKSYVDTLTAKFNYAYPMNDLSYYITTNDDGTITISSDTYYYIKNVGIITVSAGTYGTAKSTAGTYNIIYMVNTSGNVTAYNSSDTNISNSEYIIAWVNVVIS